MSVDNSVDSVRKQRRTALLKRLKGPNSVFSLYRQGTEKDVRDRMRKLGKYREYRENIKRIKAGNIF